MLLRVFVTVRDDSREKATIDSPAVRSVVGIDQHFPLVTRRSLFAATVFAVERHVACFTFPSWFARTARLLAHLLDDTLTER